MVRRRSRKRPDPDDPVEFKERRPPTPAPRTRGRLARGKRPDRRKRGGRGAHPRPPAPDGGQGAAPASDAPDASEHARHGARQDARPPPTQATREEAEPSPTRGAPQDAGKSARQNPGQDEDPRTAREIQELRQELEEVRSSLERKEEDTSKQLAGIMENLEGIQTVSEMLSVRYNPFLEPDEADVFDGSRIDPRDLIRGFMETQEFSSDDVGEPGAAEGGILDRPPGPPPEDPADPAPAGGAIATPGDPVPGHPPGKPQPVRVDVPPIPGRQRMAQPWAWRGVGGPRETYLALSWMSELSHRMPGPAIYLCLDHYHLMDWIDAEVYDWLCGLASGIVDRDEGARWSSYDLTSDQLTQIHQSNLIFLSDLFSERLRPEERRVLAQSARTYFEGI